ncbi:MAG: hypothetical protein WA138_12040 [Parvibaculum sp.]
MFEISDGTEVNSIRVYINPDDYPTLQIVSDGILQTVTTLPFLVTTGFSYFAFGWSAGGGYFADHLGNVETFDAIILPSSLCCQRLGGDSVSNFLNGVLAQTQICSLLSMDEVRAWVEHENT